MSIQISRKHSSVRFFRAKYNYLCLMLHKFCHNLKEVLYTHTHTHGNWGMGGGRVVRNITRVCICEGRVNLWA